MNLTLFCCLVDPKWSTFDLMKKEALNEVVKVRVSPTAKKFLDAMAHKEASAPATIARRAIQEFIERNVKKTAR